MIPKNDPLLKTPVEDRDEKWWNAILFDNPFVRACLQAFQDYMTAGVFTELYQNRLKEKEDEDEETWKDLNFER